MPDSKTPFTEMRLKYHSGIVEVYFYFPGKGWKQQTFPVDKAIHDFFAELSDTTFKWKRWP